MKSKTKKDSKTTKQKRKIIPKGKFSQIWKEETGSIKSGADIFVEFMEKIGVENIYHYPGGTLLDVNQSLSKSTKIKTVVSRNEQGSGFSAIGAAQFSGKTQVTMGISGPGSTNMVTPIADAFMDSVPTVFISGQVPLSLIGNMAFQEIDFNKIIRPICKKDFLIKKASDMPKILNKAFSLANSGRPGPVVVVIPKDIQQDIVKYEMPKDMASLEYKRQVKKREKKTLSSKKEIIKIKELLKNSKKPLLYIGGGIISSNSEKELREFAIKNNIPVTTTLKGLGSFDETNKELSLGMLGMHGTYYANKAVSECDLLIALGVRFDDRVAQVPEKFAQKAKVVHIDIDKKEIGRNKKPDIGLVLDSKLFLEEISNEDFYKKHKNWLERIEKWKKEQPIVKRRKASDKDKIRPDDIFRFLNEKTKGMANIVTSVGQHQMFAAQKYNFKNSKQMVTSGGLGTMGFCLPASIGVEKEKVKDIQRKNWPTIVITGDGSIQMNIQELGTIAQEKLAPKIIIFNNQKLGMVSQWEDRFYGNNYADTDFQKIEEGKVDFILIAKAYGIKGQKVKKFEKLEEAMENMMKSKEAYILDIELVDFEHVLPMIPAGKTVDEIILK